MTLLERLEQEDLIFGLKGYDVADFLQRWVKELPLKILSVLIIILVIWPGLE